MGITHFDGLDAESTFKIGGVEVTATAAELNWLDGTGAGTVVASKAVVVDSSRNIATLGTVTYDGSLVNGSGTITAAEINTLDAAVAGVTYTVGAEVSGGTITVNCQFTDADGNDMARAGAVTMYLSDASSGDDLASAPDGGVDNGTDGEIIELLDNQSWLGIYESDGDLDIVLIESGDNSFYLVSIMPNGSLDVSAVIDFD